jgi:hypothetical protein
MRVLDLTPEDLYETLDEQSLGSAFRQDFASKTKAFTQLPIQDSDLVELFDLIDANKDGAVSQQEFLGEFDLAKYEQNSESNSCMVTKSQFLTSLVDLSMA